MLVILSDLHLTDGSTGANLSPGAFHLLAERLSDLVVRASSRADGSYRPVERIDLILLGDVLDLIHSSQWIQHSVRPWDDFTSPDFINTVTRITNDTLRNNAEGLAVLRWIATEGAIRVPAANHLRQAAGGEGHPVPVHIHYLVGNHDWFFHLPGQPYNSLRKSVAQHMALANPVDRPFPHDPRESETLIDLLRRHKAFVRHGDIFDPISFNGDRDASSLSDTIAIDLLTRFGTIIESDLSHELPIETTLALRDMETFRPLLLVPTWLDGLLARTCPAPGLRKQVQRIWNQLVDELLELPVLRQFDSQSTVDLIDGLRKVLKLNWRYSANSQRFARQLLHKLYGGRMNDYSRHALTEPDFRNRRAKHIVYGHTHQDECMPLDASFAEGYVLNQVYLNTGTWQRSYRQTEHSPGPCEFVASDRLSYVAIFQGDERNGRPYETWNGTLGLQPSDATIHRIDAAGVRQAVGRPAVREASLHNPRPHFVTAATFPSVAPMRRA